MASIVERTTHFDFFKITIAQGIVIDPRHPEGATVLAFVVDPNQLERFNDQLNAALPGLVSQEPLDPVIATQLVEIERVQSCPPMSLGEVEIPRESLALRTRSSVVSEKGHGEADGAAAERGAGRTRTASDRDSGGSQAARPGSGGDAPVAGSSCRQPIEALQAEQEKNVCSRTNQRRPYALASRSSKRPSCSSGSASRLRSDRVRGLAEPVSIRRPGAVSSS